MGGAPHNLPPPVWRHDRFSPEPSYSKFKELVPHRCPPCTIKACVEHLLPRRSLHLLYYTWSPFYSTQMRQIPALSVRILPIQRLKTPVTPKVECEINQCPREPCAVTLLAKMLSAGVSQATGCAAPRFTIAPLVLTKKLRTSRGCLSLAPCVSSLSARPTCS